MGRRAAAGEGGRLRTDRPSRNEQVKDKLEYRVICERTEAGELKLYGGGGVSAAYLVSDIKCVEDYLVPRRR